MTFALLFWSLIIGVSGSLISCGLLFNFDWAPAGGAYDSVAENPRTLDAREAIEEKRRVDTRTRDRRSEIHGFFETMIVRYLSFCITPPRFW
jgi:hypothetical protein